MAASASDRHPGTLLTIGYRTIELSPFVDEAISALGYIQPVAAPWLVRQIVRYGVHDNGRSIRKAGSLLSPEERIERGVPGTEEPFTHEAWNALTELGRLDPVRRFDRTCLRSFNAARSALTRQGDLRALAHANSVFAGARFIMAMRTPCWAARDLHGQILPEPPVLPLTSCDRDICACSWRLLSKREVSREQAKFIDQRETNEVNDHGLPPGADGPEPS